MHIPIAAVAVLRADEGATNLAGAVGKRIPDRPHAKQVLPAAQIKGQIDRVAVRLTDDLRRRLAIG